MVCCLFYNATMSIVPSNKGSTFFSRVVHWVDIDVRQHKLQFSKASPPVTAKIA